ncbi:MAG: hypothetical protein ACJAYU_003454 [Bradymonadia bacterium]|jgi:hypothetical protein
MKPFLLLLPLFALAACGPKAPSCAIPMTQALALDWLEGEWTVTDHTGQTDGNIEFTGGRVETTWEDVTLRGDWQHRESTQNAHSIRLIIDEALEGDVRVRYSVFDEVDITLVFAGPDELYALQGEGVWTVWERMPLLVSE